GAVRDHALAGLKAQPGAVEFYRDLVRLKRHETGNAPDLGPGVLVRPRGAPRVLSVVVTAQGFVRAERLAVGRGERGFIDVGARDVPAGREPGFIQGQRAAGVRDDLVAVAGDEVAGGLADVDAMVAVGGMADDPLGGLVESVHGPP